MNLKLKTLENFLEDQGFCLEANACSELIRIATPIGMFGDEYFSVKKTDLDKHGIHGWVYILKTRPRKGGTAPSAWYVGSSTAPERRFMEHAFSSTPVEVFPTANAVGAVMMGVSGLDPNINASPESFSRKRDITHRGDRPINNSYYEIKSPAFTGSNVPLEVVCMQVVYRTPETANLTNTKALKIKERTVFTDLAKFVGGKNIGGDKPWMDSVVKDIKTNDIPTSSDLSEPAWSDYEDNLSYQKSVSDYEDEVKAYIAKKFGCESNVGDEYKDFADELNKLEWSNFVDKDFELSVGLDNLASGTDKRRRSIAKEWVISKLQPLSKDQTLSLKKEIINLLIYDKDVFDKKSLAKAINLKIPYLKGIDDYSLAKLEGKEVGFGFSFRPYFDFKDERDLVIKALRKSYNRTEAAIAFYDYLKEAGTAEEADLPTVHSMTERLKDRARVLQVSIDEHLGGELDYIMFAESGEKIYKQDIEKALRCAKSVNDAARFFGRDRSNSRTFSRHVYKLLYPGLPQKEQKRMIKEEYLSKESGPEDREWVKQRGFTCFNPNPSRDELLEALIMSNGNNREVKEILNTTESIIKARRKEEGLSDKAVMKIRLERMNEEGPKELDIDTVTYDETEP